MRQEPPFKRDIRAWTCADCGRDCFQDERDYYMIWTYLWIQFGVAKGMLCIDSLEKRMGRELTGYDFTPCPLNFDNPYSRAKLAEIGMFAPFRNVTLV